MAKKVGTKPERVEGWEQEGELTYKQAEKLAKATHTPFGRPPSACAGSLAPAPSIRSDQGILIRHSLLFT